MEHEDMANISSPRLRPFDYSAQDYQALTNLVNAELAVKHETPQSLTDKDDATHKAGKTILRQVAELDGRVVGFAEARELMRYPKPGRLLAAALAIVLSLACRSPIAFAPATPTLTPTFTASATSPPAATSTMTATPSPTPPPTATTTATETPTLTPSPLPTDTPTSTPLPLPVATAAVVATPLPPPPTDTPLPTVDFRIAHWRLWPLAQNSGCAKGNHSIYITVLNVDGAPLDGIIVGDSWNNVEVISGAKGLGKAEVNLWTNTMEMTVKRNGFTNEAYTSEVSFPFSSYMTTIPNDQMIAAGYCANEADCEWKRANDSYYCGGHYSWEVVFQATRPIN